MGIALTLPTVAFYSRGRGGKAGHADGGRRAGNFVISLDFELMWGVRDHATRASYGRNVLGGRQAVAAMLDLFHKRGIRATWATVGALLCESKEDESIARIKHTAVSRAVLGSLEDCTDERRDPFSFRRVARAPHRLLRGARDRHAHLLASLRARAGRDAQWVRRRCVLRSVAAQGMGKYGCKSIVFPRNQYAQAHLEACSLLGLTHFRGNEHAWFYPVGFRRQADQAPPALPARRQLCQSIGSERVGSVEEGEGTVG